MWPMHRHCSVYPAFPLTLLHLIIFLSGVIFLFLECSIALCSKILRSKILPTRLVYINSCCYMVLAEPYSSFKNSVCSSDFYFYFLLFRAVSVAYGSSQARGWIRVASGSLHHSSWQHGILNPLSEARGRTRIFVDAGRVHEPQQELPQFWFLVWPLN